MTTQFLVKSLKDIIDKKYDEVQATIDNSQPFYKIYKLEGNAVGQIGEVFLKKVISSITDIKEDINQIIHDEYDIETTSGIKIEIKTARHGVNGSFQFNSINPNYNPDYIICLGICEDQVRFRIIPHESIRYNHTSRNGQDRGFYIDIDGRDKKLVQMNPGNQASHKLTLSLQQLHEIKNLQAELESILL